MSHLTALDRRALAFMKANNATTARSKRKTWTLEQIDGRAILRTRWTEKDDAVDVRGLQVGGADADHLGRAHPGEELHADHVRDDGAALPERRLEVLRRDRLHARPLASDLLAAIVDRASAQGLQQLERGHQLR